MSNNSIRTKLGRTLDTIGLRAVARKIESVLSPNTFQPADKNTLEAVEKCLNLAKQNGLIEQGDYYEFGIFRGYTFWYAQKVMTDLGNTTMRFFGLDSFQGLPETKGIDTYKNDFVKGQFCASYEYVRDNLDKNGVDWNRTILVPGYFEDTLKPDLKNKHNMKKASVALVDCDLYESAQQVLSFLKDMLMNGTLLIFDDWNAFDKNDDLGERKAFREFLENSPSWTAEPLFCYGTYGQAFKMSENASE